MIKDEKNEFIVDQALKYMSESSKAELSHILKPRKASAERHS